MISISHMYKTYPGPTHALSNVELNIEKGEFVFLTGPSGAGKTTLFRMISAFDRPSSGHVEVAGYNLADIPLKEIPFFRRKIGVVFQDFRLLKDRTIFENVALPLEVLRERSSYVSKRVHEVLDQVGLVFKKDQYPEQISGGEQQRTAIARALVHRPGLLIADEPTGNLDHELREEIMNLFETVNAQGTTLFVATHDMEMVKRRSRRSVYLVQGHMKNEASSNVASNS